MGFTDIEPPPRGDPTRTTEPSPATDKKDRVFSGHVERTTSGVFLGSEICAATTDEPADSVADGSTEPGTDEQPGTQLGDELAVGHVPARIVPRQDHEQVADQGGDADAQPNNTTPIPPLDLGVVERLIALADDLDWSKPGTRDTAPMLKLVNESDDWVFDDPYDRVIEAAAHGQILMSACRSTYGTAPVLPQDRWMVFQHLTKRVRTASRLVAQMTAAQILPPGGWLTTSTHIGRAMNHHTDVGKLVVSAQKRTDHEWGSEDHIDAVFALTARASTATKREEMRALLAESPRLTVRPGTTGSVVLDAVRRKRKTVDPHALDPVLVVHAERLWQANRLALQGVGSEPLLERLVAFITSQVQAEAAA